MCFRFTSRSALAVTFFVAVHIRHMELVRTYKKEVRLAYAVRQLPYVGTLHLKKGKDGEGVEVGLILLRKSKTQEVGLNTTLPFWFSELPSQFWNGMERFDLA